MKERGRQMEKKGKDRKGVESKKGKTKLVIG